MRDEDLRGLRRLAEAQGDAASWSRLAGALARAEEFDEASEALGRARAVGGADPSVEDATAAGLRGLARERGDAAGWNRCAAALVGARRFEDAGEALVRARAVGEADAALEDALEAVVDGVGVAEVDGTPARPAGVGALGAARVAHASSGVTLGPTDRLRRWGSALAWSPDSRQLFAYTDGAIVGARGPAWELEKVAACDWIVTALAVDLESRFLVASRTPERGFVSLLGVLDLGEREWARGKHARASEGPTLVTSLACWHRTPTVWAADALRVTAYARSGLELAGPVRAWAERERVSLSWNGDSQRWPTTIAGTPRVEVAHGSFIYERPRLGFPTRRAADRFRERAAAFEQLRTHSGALEGIAASPSGRFVAIWNEAEPSLGVVDLAGETARRFALEGRARNAAWAPSGRRLAVALEQGIAVLEFGVAT